MDDRLILRKELAQQLSVHRRTISNWMKEGKLPPPDVKINTKTIGWKLSTLEAAGVRVT